MRDELLYRFDRRYPFQRVFACAIHCTAWRAATYFCGKGPNCLNRTLRQTVSWSGKRQRSSLI